MTPPDLHHALPLPSSLSDDVQRVRWAGWVIAGFLATLLIGGVAATSSRAVDNTERIGKNEARIELQYQQLKEGQEELKNDVKSLVKHLTGSTP